jgi:hypothetical protein
VFSKELKAGIGQNSISFSSGGCHTLVVWEVGRMLKYL